MYARKCCRMANDSSDGSMQSFDHDVPVLLHLQPQHSKAIEQDWKEHWGENGRVKWPRNRNKTIIKLLILIAVIEVIGWHLCICQRACFFYVKRWPYFGHCQNNIIIIMTRSFIQWWQILRNCPFYGWKDSGKSKVYLKLQGKIYEVILLNINFHTKITCCFQF